MTTKYFPLFVISIFMCIILQHCISEHDNSQNTNLRPNRPKYIEILRKKHSTPIPTSTTSAPVTPKSVPSRSVPSLRTVPSRSVPADKQTKTAPSTSRFSVRRSTTVPSTSTPVPKIENPSDAEDEDDDDEEPPRRVIGNSRGGAEFEGIEQSSSKVESIVKPEKPEQTKLETTSRKPSSTSGRRSYLEYFRPGAKPRAVKRTTKPPKRFSANSDENSNANETPVGCSECRFYCKRCRGTEEVTSGGVWGCCNHNCCGGRCSCQKFKIL